VVVSSKSGKDVTYACTDTGMSADEATANRESCLINALNARRRAELRL
jgi:predicted MarR family transcription regulator